MKIKFRIELNRINRNGRDQFAGGSFLSGLYQPIFICSECFSRQFPIDFAAGNGRLNFVTDTLQRGYGLESGGTDPRFNPGATPAGIDQTDRHIQLLPYFPAEALGNAGEAADIFRSADPPYGFRPDIGLRVDFTDIWK